jgi:HSP20 family protein
MTDDPKKKPNKDDFNNPFPNDFSNFFKNIQKIIEDMLSNGDFSDLEKFFEEQSDKFPFVWGFSFNRGPDGRPRFDQFGDMIKKMGFERPFSADDDSERIREPLADVIEEETIIRVLIELPGVEKKDIDLASTELLLKVRARTDNRNYKKEIQLPASVIPESASAKFNNGVLEVTLKKTKSEYTKKIDIE